MYMYNVYLTIISRMRIFALEISHLCWCWHLSVLVGNVMKIIYAKIFFSVGIFQALGLRIKRIQILISTRVNWKFKSYRAFGLNWEYSCAKMNYYRSFRLIRKVSAYLFYYCETWKLYKICCRFYPNNK